MGEPDYKKIADAFNPRVSTDESGNEVRLPSLADEWLQSGQWSQGKYDRNLQLLRDAQAGSLGVEKKDDFKQPLDRVPDVPYTTAGNVRDTAVDQYNQLYKSGRLSWARGSGYAPGVGDVPMVDGPEWESVRERMPNRFADVVLNGSNRNILWDEPTREEARLALAAAGDARAGSSENDVRDDAYMEYSDKEWAKAYDLARQRGETLYRSSRIGDASPEYLRTLKRLHIAGSRISAFTGAFKRAYLPGSDASATAMYGEKLGGLLDAAAPPDAEVDRENFQQKQRFETSDEGARYMSTIGSFAGSVAPGSITRRIGSAADAALGVGGLGGAQGVVEGMTSGLPGILRGGVAGAIGSFPVDVVDTFTTMTKEEELGLREQTDTASRLESASRDSLVRAGATGVLSSLLHAPGAMSRASVDPRYGARAAAMSNLKEAGGGPSLFGLQPPDAYKTMSKAQKADAMSSGYPSKFAHEAAESVGQNISRSKDKALGFMESKADRIARDLERYDDSLADYTERVRKAVVDTMEEAKDDAADMNQIAIGLEGAPRRGAKIDPVKQPGIPTVSSEKMIAALDEVGSRMRFLDGKEMTPELRKFKDQVDRLYHRRTVSKEELPLYDRIAHATRKSPTEKGKYEVLFPRYMNAQEMDNFVQVAQEYANFTEAKQTVGSAGWTEFATRAKKLRDEAFPILGHVKEYAYAERVRNDELLRSLGLKKGSQRIEGVDQTQQIMNALKGFAEGTGYTTPEGMSIPAAEFERWVALQSSMGPKGEDLLESYIDLKRLGRARKLLGEGATGMDVSGVQASMSELKSVMSGKRAKADDVMDAILDGTAKRLPKGGEVKDIFHAFGVNPGRNIDYEQRFGLREKLINVMNAGKKDADFQAIASVLKPEDRIQFERAADVSRRMRRLLDDATIGSEGWTKKNTEDFVRDMEKLVPKWRSHGDGSRIFTEAVDEMAPSSKRVLIRLRGAIDYQDLMSKEKGSLRGVGSATSGVKVYAAKFDFVNHWLDALHRTVTGGEVPDVDQRSLTFGQFIGQGFEKRNNFGMALLHPTETATALVSGDTNEDSFNRITYSTGPWISEAIDGAARYLSFKKDKGEEK